MSHSIVSKLKPENGKIIVKSRANNVYPICYVEQSFDDTKEMRDTIRQLIIDRLWQPVRKDTRFIRSLCITHYFDGTPF